MLYKVIVIKVTARKIQTFQITHTRKRRKKFHKDDVSFIKNLKT